MNKIKQSAEQLVNEGNVKVLAFDYLQLMTDKGKEKLPENWIHGMLIESGRKRELNIISQFFSNLSKELKIPIIITSQLKRTVENRKN